MQQFQQFYWVPVHIRKSVNWNKCIRILLFGFHIMVLGCSHVLAWEGIGPPTWEPGLTNQNGFFTTNGLSYRQKYSCFISCPGGWSQTIPQVKKTDVEVLSWHGYTWSAVVRPVGRTTKFSKTTLEEAYGREINIKFSGNSSSENSCSQHVNCKLPQLETSVA
jgi:hypothetical protein